MKNRNIFWGVVVLMIGVLLLLNTMGILPFSVWEVFWPVMLILAGLWFLFGGKFIKGSGEVVHFSHPLANIRQAQIELHHGAGELNISAASSDDREFVLDGTFVGGVEPQVTQHGDVTRLKLRAPMDMFPFGAFPHREGFQWDMTLSPHVPMELNLKTGANKSSLDLKDLMVNEISLETGASDTEVFLPAHTEFTRFKIQSGAASVNIHVPQDVAARIHVSGALMGGQINQARFPMLSSQPGDKIYQSPDYEAAEKQAEIKIEAGVGSINIH